MLENEPLKLIRNKNFSELLNSLRSSGEASIAQLANENPGGITTVKKYIQQALEEKMIEEAGEAESTGGRKAMKYRIRPDYQHFLILIVDNNSLLSLVYDFNMRVVSKNTIEFEISDFLTALHTSMEAASKDHPIGTICVSMPCVIKDGVIIDWYYNPSLVGTNIEKILEEKYKTNVLIQNDMKLTVLGESKTHNGASNIVTAQFNHNGIGVGEMVNGHVLEGSSGFAGEVGYMNTGRKEVSNTTYLSRIIRSVIVCINPEIIVFYSLNNPKKLKKIFEEATKGLPRYAIPEFFMRENYAQSIALGFLTLINKCGFFKKTEEIV